MRPKPLIVRYARTPDEMDAMGGQTPCFVLHTAPSDGAFNLMKESVESFSVDEVHIIGISMCTGWRVFVNREVHFRSSAMYTSFEQRGIEERQAAQRICPLRKPGEPDYRGWVHVVSPLNTIQELVDRDLHYPWRVMVVCLLLNQTHGRQVRPMIDEFFLRWPTPEGLMNGDLVELAEFIKPLGLYNRRATGLKRMTQDYRAGRRWQECHGVGPYALDSIDLYVQGKLGVDPKDTWLKPYLEWRNDGGPRVGWDWENHIKWREQFK